MSKLFGTDGVRGIANTELTPELALALGRAAAQVLGGGASRPRVMVGRDTRASGDMLASALAAGLLSAGADVIRGRVLPTPAVAFLVTELSASAGAVISASHNPSEDNGIKFFGSDGFKLSDTQEQQIENQLDSNFSRPTGAGIGRLEFVPDANDRYVDHALKALEGRSLAGLKIVMDCAHGAAYKTSPQALSQTGAEVIVIGDKPDGLNINEGGGSLQPETVAEQVLASGANLGLAHDGDADRVIAVDEKGQVVDGDAMLAALALELSGEGKLFGNQVVTTVMANLGFRKAMEGAGISVIETAVGDRFVLEAMCQNGAVLGGEQSGHLIFLNWSTTGDGLVTGLRLAGLMASTGKPLSEIAAQCPRFPQVLSNIKVTGKERLANCDPIWKAVEQEQIKLGSTGRVLVRPSGTEQLVRVMVEAPDDSTASAVANHISQVVREELATLPAI
ncbi:MAG: phosphoglucosamine mutase [Actinomycetota bacterium]